MDTILARDENARKPGASTSSSYDPGCTASKTYVPAADDFVSKVTRVPSLISLTVASGTTAPLESCTVPRTREVVPWAKASPQAHTNPIKHENPLLRICWRIAECGSWRKVSCASGQRAIR